MGCTLSPFADFIGNRKQYVSQAGPHLVGAKATETVAGDESLGIRDVGVVTTSGLVEIADPRGLQASEQELTIVGTGATSGQVARSHVETRFDRVAESSAPVHVAAKPGRTETTLKVARQHVASIEQQIANTAAALNGDPNIEIDRHRTVRTAKAQLDRTRLDLSYATVTAPDDGTVARVDDLQVGNFVDPGTPYSRCCRAGASGSRRISAKRA
jgi:hypothetical protein